MFKKQEQLQAKNRDVSNGVRLGMIRSKKAKTFFAWSAWNFIDFDRALFYTPILTSSFSNEFALRWVPYSLSIQEFYAQLKPENHEETFFGQNNPQGWSGFCETNSFFDPLFGLSPIPHESIDETFLSDLILRHIQHLTLTKNTLSIWCLSPPLKKNEKELHPKKKILQYVHREVPVSASPEEDGVVFCVYQFFGLLKSEALETDEILQEHKNLVEHISIGNFNNPCFDL